MTHKIVEKPDNKCIQIHENPAEHSTATGTLSHIRFKTAGQDSNLPAAGWPAGLSRINVFSDNIIGGNVWTLLFHTRLNKSQGSKGIRRLPIN